MHSARAPRRTGRSGSRSRPSTRWNRLWNVAPAPGGSSAPALGCSRKRMSANWPATQAALARKCPAGDANVGSTYCTSIGSSCRL